MAERAGKRAAAEVGAGGFGAVRVGIGGWRFDPWRDTFYPPDLKRADELRFAAAAVTAIEINATFYRTQTEATFAGWRDAVPDGFVFAVKAPRAATYASDAVKRTASVARFLDSGLLALGPTLGPILWQFAPTRRFDADAFRRFLDELPPARHGVPLRHAIEMRHRSARTETLAVLLAERGAALALVARPGEPVPVALTAPFVYARLEETVDTIETGYAEPDLARWASRLRELSGGRIPADLAEAALGPAPTPAARDVFAFVIGAAKRRNPAAAVRLRALLG